MWLLTVWFLHNIWAKWHHNQEQLWPKLWKYGWKSTVLLKSTQFWDVLVEVLDRGIHLFFCLFSFSLLVHSFSICSLFTTDSRIFFLSSKFHYCTVFTQILPISLLSKVKHNHRHMQQLSGSALNVFIHTKRFPLVDRSTAPLDLNSPCEKVDLVNTSLFILGK